MPTCCASRLTTSTNRLDINAALPDLGFQRPFHPGFYLLVVATCTSVTPRSWPTNWPGCPPPGRPPEQLGHRHPALPRKRRWRNWFRGGYGKRRYPADLYDTFSPVRHRPLRQLHASRTTARARAWPKRRNSRSTCPCPASCTMSCITARTRQPTRRPRDCADKDDDETREACSQPLAERGHLLCGTHLLAKYRDKMHWSTARSCARRLVPAARYAGRGLPERKLPAISPASPLHAQATGRPGWH